MLQLRRALPFSSIIVLIGAALALASPVCAGTMAIVSTPAGATVEINGVAVGKTPYKQEMPGGYFHRPHSVFSTRLEHRMTLRISMEGYSPQEIELADGPFHFSTLNGRNHGDYWLLKSDHFEVTLQPLSANSAPAAPAARAASVATDQSAAEKVSSANTKSAGIALPEAPPNAIDGNSPDSTVEKVIRDAMPAVVLLRTTRALGSGFFLTEDGLIATNKHVVEGESAAIVVEHSGTRLYAHVIYSDPRLDLALLRVSGAGYPHLTLAAAASVQRGETVIALGNPASGLPGTVTKGIVSAVGKLHGEPGDWVQTDAAVNPGNSGGPLLNLRGEVEGMNTLKGRDKEGIAFALSAGDIASALENLHVQV
jgi:serine protease Do